MKIELNIDPEKLDYDEINRIIKEKLGAEDMDTFISNIIDSPREEEGLDVRDELVFGLLKDTASYIFDRYNEVYLDTRDYTLTDQGKRAVQDAVAIAIKGEVDKILTPLVESEDFKNFVLTSFSKIFPNILFERMRNDAKRVIDTEYSAYMKDLVIKNRDELKRVMQRLNMQQ